MRSTAQPGQAAEVEYKDSWTDLAFIALCRRAYGNLAGWQSAKSWRTSESYAGMVEVSKALMQRYRTAAEQQHAVIKGFPRIPPTFRWSPALAVLQLLRRAMRMTGSCRRKLFPYTRRGAEVNAQLSLRFFEWLVSMHNLSLVWHMCTSLQDLFPATGGAYESRGSRDRRTDSEVCSAH